MDRLKAVVRDQVKVFLLYIGDSMVKIVGIIIGCLAKRAKYIIFNQAGDDVAPKR